MQQHIKIITFGYLHGSAPAAHLTVDLREHFRDPHVNPALRHMTAYDAEVREAVLDTGGIFELIEAMTDTVSAFLSGPSAGPLTVAVGCAGGRHRAATVGMELMAALALQGVSCELTHRDLDKDVVTR